jgi:hypothetical protein
MMLLNEQPRKPKKVCPVSAPSALPLEARRAAWDALWKRLLAPTPDDDPEPENDDEERPDEAA